MTYDEIRITTRREIDICEGAIRKLETTIAALEEKLRRAGLDLHGGSSAMCSDAPINEDHRHWQESCSALERWKERLAAHRQIMDM